MRWRTKTTMVLFVPMLFLLLFAPQAGPSMLHGSVGDGAHVDLVVRKVTVTPARAHVGDTVRIEMEWEYWGDIINNYYDTTFAEVLANGKPVAKNPLSKQKNSGPAPERGPVPIRIFPGFLICPDEPERSKLCGCIVGRGRQLILDPVSRPERRVDEIGGEVRGDFV